MKKLKLEWLKGRREVTMQARFEKGVYRDCRWCGGRGCLSCPVEAERAYKREFPNGPEPLCTITNEEFDQADIREAMGQPGIERDHGDLGRLLQAIRDAVKGGAK